MRAYSLDLRERVLADCDGGESNDAVARKYRVSASWIRKLKQLRRETGSIAPRVRQTPAPKWAEHTDEIRQAVDRKPDATLSELREALGRFSEATLCRALRQLRLSWKKSPAGRGTRSARCRRPTPSLASGDVRLAGRPTGFHRRIRG